MALEEDGRPRRVTPKKVRIWDELTIRVGTSDYDFIRFTHGQEVMCNDTPRSKARAEREMHASMLEIVEARVTEYQEMVGEISEKQ